MSAHSSAYDDDLAYIHDVGYDFHARGFAPSLVALLKEARLAGSVVVDLGCGSGIWAEQLSQAGFRAVGVESFAGDDHVRQAPRSRRANSMWRRFSISICRRAGRSLALGEVLCYQFDRANNRQALARLFRRAYDAPMPGGLFIFDIVELGLDRGRAPTWRAGDDWACLVAYEYDERRMQLARHITTFRKAGDALSARARDASSAALRQPRDRRPLAASRLSRSHGAAVWRITELRPMCAGFIARKAAV